MPSPSPMAAATAAASSLAAHYLLRWRDELRSFGPALELPATAAVAAPAAAKAAGPAGVTAEPATGAAAGREAAGAPASVPAACLPAPLDLEVLAPYWLHPSGCLKEAAQLLLSTYTEPPPAPDTALGSEAPGAGTGSKGQDVTETGAACMQAGLKPEANGREGNGAAEAEALQQWLGSGCVPPEVRRLLAASQQYNSQQQYNGQAGLGQQLQGQLWKDDSNSSGPPVQWVLAHFPCVVVAAVMCLHHAPRLPQQVLRVTARCASACVVRACVLDLFACQWPQCPAWSKPHALSNVHAGPWRLR